MYLLNITPQHHRLYLGGGSFSTEIKGFVLRGEGAYYNGKYYQTEDPLANDALVQKDYLHYLVGVDFSIENVKFSTQFIQEAILGYDENMQNEEIQNTITFLARYDMLRETLHLELFSYIGLTNVDALIRPKITYDFDDSFSVLLGSNIFIGDREGRFGQYKDNSMGYVKLKYSFPSYGLPIEFFIELYSLIVSFLKVFMSASQFARVFKRAYFSKSNNPLSETKILYGRWCNCLCAFLPLLFAGADILSVHTTKLH